MILVFQDDNSTTLINTELCSSINVLPLSPDSVSIEFYSSTTSQTVKNIDPKKLYAQMKANTQPDEMAKMLAFTLKCVQ